MAKVCARCQRVSSKLFALEEGGEAELCKKCLALAQAERQQQLPPPSPGQPFVGRVLSARGPVPDVEVAVQGLAAEGACAVTDAAGVFTLGQLAADRQTRDADAFFELLQASHPGGCESWLRQAMAGGPPEYERLFAAVLRHSDIGAAIDKDTFVALATQPEVWKRIGASVRQSLGRNPDLVLSFRKEGFAPCTIPLAETGVSSVQVDMQPVAARGAVDPLQGGVVEDPKTGASVTLPAGSRLVQAEDGLPHLGEVVVSLAVIDAADPASVEAMPGDFSAVDAQGGQVQLETLGAVWVGLEGSTGGKLEMAPGSPGFTVELPSQVPINFERLGVPPTIWEFNEATGKWQEEAQTTDLTLDGFRLPRAGEVPALVLPVEPPVTVQKKEKGGKKKGKGGGDEFHAKDFNSLRGDAEVWTPETFLAQFGIASKKIFKMNNVPRGGYWNCDCVYSVTFLAGQVLGAGDLAAKGANVWSVGIDYVGASPRSGLDEEGGFSVLAQGGGCTIHIHVLLPQEEGLPPLKLQFGPFKTGVPGASKALGALRASHGTQVPIGKAEEEEEE